MARHKFVGLMSFIISTTFGIGAQAYADEQISYSINLAGIEIGDMELAVRSDGSRYRVRLDGSYRVLLWSGAISSRAEGEITPVGLSPRRFQTDSFSDEPSTMVIEFQQRSGNIKWSRTPPAPSEWTEGRLPLQRGHLLQALDPISALAVSALGSADSSTPEVCNREVRVFTGFSVFALRFQGAQARALDRVSCPVIYQALSGHREGSSSVERLSQSGSIKIDFERLQSGVWLPSRVSLPTLIGTLTVQRT